VKKNDSGTLPVYLGALPFVRAVLIIYGLNRLVFKPKSSKFAT
jgi:hypothetical protein